MITLQHLRSGRILTVPTVAAAARQLHWGPNGTFHLDNVLKGKRLHHRGWGIPKVLNEEIHLKDVFGNQYQETVAELARKVGVQAANRARRGVAYQDLVPIKQDLSKVLTPKTYTVEGYLFRKRYIRGEGSPLVRLDSYKQAPQKLGISLMSAWMLSHGYRASIKGVTFIRAYTKPRRARAATKLRPVGSTPSSPS